MMVDFSPPARAYRGAEYKDVYERWTRHEKILYDADVALEVWATYKSQDFREAFVAHYAEAYALKDDARESLRQAQREASVVSYEFVVTAQSGNYRWNDLEKSSSPWRVLLVDAAGHEMAADKVKVEKLPDMFQEEFFPAKTPFSKTYSVRFTRPTGRDDAFVGERSGSLTLRFAGPLGRADLVWSARS